MRGAVRRALIAAAEQEGNNLKGFGLKNGSSPG